MPADDKLYNAFRIAKILEKYARKEPLAAEEQAEVDQWLAVNGSNRNLVERISDENQLAFDLLELRDTDTESELAKIGNKLRGAANTQKWMWYYTAAAMLLLFLSVGLGIYWYRINSGKPMELTIDMQNDALPGGNRATLTLTDGRTINLNETQTGIVMGDDVAYTDGTTVLEEYVNEGVDEYVLSTPRGGTYQITLPDGTGVWLNAESTLRYPSKFKSNERVVELAGEAYFDVSKQGTMVPFLVKTRGQTIEVLGTQFNVSAYAAEATTKTTLVKGRVRVTALTTQQPQVVVLKPSQQSVVQPEGMVINQVDVQPFIAWKDGYFHFERTPFVEVLAQMSRWYDIELVYEGGVPYQTFTGKMSRNVNLTNVLKLFRGSGIRFRFENKKLFIH